MPRSSLGHPQVTATICTRPVRLAVEPSLTLGWFARNIERRSTTAWAAVQDEIARRCRENLPEVRLAYLFGSRATGRDRPDSDIDVAFLVDKRCVRSPSAVNRTIRHLVARVSGGEIRSDLLDVTLLNEAPVLLCHRVLRDGQLLHARDETERVRFAVRTMREYQDFAPWLGEHTRQRIARLKDDRGAADGGRRDILAAARRVGRLLGTS